MLLLLLRIAKDFRLHDAVAQRAGIYLALRALRHVIGSVHGRIDGILLPIHAFFDLSVVLAGIPPTADANRIIVEVVLLRFHRFPYFAGLPKVFSADCTLKVLFQNHLIGMTRCRYILVFVGTLPFTLQSSGMIAGIDMAAVLAPAVDVIVILPLCEIRRLSGEILVAVQADLILIEGSVRDMVAVVADILVCRTFKSRPSIHPFMRTVDAVTAAAAQAGLEIVILQTGDGLLRLPYPQHLSAVHAKFNVLRVTVELMNLLIHRGHGS